MSYSYIFSQDLDYYYLEFKEEQVPQQLQTTLNPDQTLTLSMQNEELAGIFNTKPIYKFERAFYYNLNPVLDRVYLISTTSEESLSDIVNRDEIERIEQVYFDEELIDEESSFTILPNDFDDIVTGGRNTALDLIRAPLAWTITRGEGQVIGWSDAKINYHEDLIGKVIYELDTNPHSNNIHGAGTAGIAVANTNNNMGIASVAPEATIASSPNIGISRIEHLVNEVPEIRVINASWGSCWTDPDPIQALKYQDLLDQGYLVVAGGGNTPCPEGKLFYPAAYDATMSVTTVGHRVAPTYYHNIIDGGGSTPPGYFRSWKDVYLFRPDVSNTYGHNLRANIDITAPGQLLTGLKIDDSTDPWTSTYNTKTATSPTAPIVTGVAALVFAANPNLTAQQAKDIILNTADDIYQIPYNQPFIGQLGSGRVNAYRAVLTAKCMDDPNYIGELDLMVRNSLVDYGVEPDTNTGSIMWNSSEIWVRNNSGESYIDVHQNPEYDPVNPNFVNVRVTNRSCVTSSGNDQLKLYWSKANTALSWPEPWDGSETIGNNIPLGGEVGTLTIPSLEPGQEAILEFEWMVPNPEDYLDLNPNPWHFCLLARIESDDDPMTNEENDVVITTNVINNNNIGWKNTTVIDVIPNTPTIGGVVAVSNPFSEARNFRLELVVDNKDRPNEYGKKLFEEAEIGVEMDDVLYSAWERGNKEGVNFKATYNPKKIIATDTITLIDNIQFLPNEIGSIFLTFNFLTKELSSKRNYTYHIIQKDLENGSIIGGETYEIKKQPRTTFSANAGSDKEIDRSESVTLEALSINESAIYNWYDLDGNLIHTGTSITVSPQFTQEYQLEVISNLDGLKDYDKMEVTVNPYHIESLTPNPVMSQVTVNYFAANATSAYVMLVHQNSGNTSNYIIDSQIDSHTIDLSNFVSGLYSVILVCDGEIQDSKNLIKQ